MRARIIAAPVIALAGCGSDSADAPTKPDFIASADKICAGGQ